MSNIDDVRDLIRGRIKSNGIGLITGDALQAVLLEMVDLDQDLLTDIQYLDLLNMRENSSLVPGQFYRITDYVTTTSQENTQSERHQFDVIVLALTNDTLAEQAWACHHEGDTYFQNSHLESWKIWYCLDNDTSRFAWAVPTSSGGRGVIYRMIDEWNNDCPYDFKNIKIKHSNDTETYPGYYYTFTVILLGINDYSLDGAYCYGNTMCRYVDGGKQRINGNVFINAQKNQCHSNSFGNNCQFNAFGNNCYSNSFGDNCDSNNLGSNCRNNSFGISCYNNSFGSSCYNNSFGYECYNNSFGNSCYNNSFGNGCYNNSFGYVCSSNTFGNGCNDNSLGNECYYNSFGNRCYFNTFGNSCNDNSFGHGCSSNKFGVSCYYNTFGNDCSSNEFGSDCRNNSFSNSCYSNRFGNNCRNNSFSNSCYENKFGNGSYGNSFKNNCHDNIFGLGCGYNSFGNSCKFNIFGESTSNIKSYYRYITFDDGNSYINLNCTTTTSTSNYYQNVRIGLGVNNTTTKKTISDSNVGQTYETLYKPANSKELTA